MTSKDKVFEIPKEEAKIEKPKKKNVMTLEQKQRLIENLRRGREAKKANLDASKKEVEAPKEKPKVVEAPKESPKVVETPKETPKVNEERERILDSLVKSHMEKAEKKKVVKKPVVKKETEVKVIEPVKPLEQVKPPVIPKVVPSVPQVQPIIYSTLKKAKWA
jgi:hypothetical protein